MAAPGARRAFGGSCWASKDNPRPGLAQTNPDKSGYDSCMKRYGFMGRACLGGVGLAAELSAAQGRALPAAPAGAAPMPRVVEKDGRWALMVDGAPYLMLGMQVNNSSAWPAML